MIGIYTSIGLAVVFGIAKWQTAYRLKMMRSELALLEAERDRRETQLGQSESMLALWTNEQEQLNAECTILTKENNQLVKRIGELDEVERSIEERRADDPL